MVGEVLVLFKKCASKVTVFIYNHVALIAWLRKRPGWTDIVRVGATRFATTFLSFGSLHVHKHDLQALVTSKFFVGMATSRVRIGFFYIRTRPAGQDS